MQGKRHADERRADGRRREGKSPPCGSDPSGSGDRAVSDLIGYVLMVGVILVGVGLTATVGVDHLESAQLSQNARGVEHTMELLENDLDEIQAARAAVRSTTLSISSGQLGVAAGSSPSAMTVNVSGTGDSPTTYQMGTIAYDFDGGVVAYEGGGVFLRTRGGNAIDTASPTVRCNDDRAVVSIVRLQGPAAGHSYGGSIARLQATENRSVLRFPENRSGPGSIGTSTGVNVTVDSEFESGWRSYLLGSDQAWTTDPTTSWDYRCEPPGGGTMPVYVRQTVLNVSVDR